MPIVRCASDTHFRGPFPIDPTPRYDEVQTPRWLKILFACSLGALALLGAIVLIYAAWT